MRSELNGNGLIADFSAFGKCCNGSVAFVKRIESVVNKMQKLKVCRCGAGEGVECINL